MMRGDGGDVNECPVGETLLLYPIGVLEELLKCLLY